MRPSTVAVKLVPAALMLAASAEATSAGVSPAIAVWL